jgi:hypothetical protein
MDNLLKSTQNSKFRRTYRYWICFNKNLIIAGICSLVISAIVTQYYDDIYNGRNGASNVLLVTLVSLLTECVVETPIFVLLYYYYNKNRYVDSSTGNKHVDLIKADLKKLLMAFSISDVIYAIAQIFLLFYFLKNFQLETYQAVIYSSIISWTIFVVVLNVSTISLRFFENGKK